MDVLGQAVDHLKATVKARPVAGWLRRKARQSPAKATRAMRWAVAWWEAEAKPHIPVAATRSEKQKRAGAKGARYRRVGRGQLRKRTLPFVVEKEGQIIGGLASGVHYAIWLMAGTKRIAGGRVLAWKPGRATIKMWPAKAAGGSRRAELPILVPWQAPARAKLVEALKRELVS